jgi:hypothetical protein
MTSQFALLLAALDQLPEGVYVDAVIGGLTHDEYDQLPGRRETLDHDPNTGELVFSKDIHLPVGTLTVETSYGRVAA